MSIFSPKIPVVGPVQGALCGITLGFFSRLAEESFNYFHTGFWDPHPGYNNSIALLVGCMLGLLIGSAVSCINPSNAKVRRHR